MNYKVSGVRYQASGIQVPSSEKMDASNLLWNLEFGIWNFITADPSHLTLLL